MPVIDQRREDLVRLSAGAAPGQRQGEQASEAGIPRELDESGRERVVGGERRTLAEELCGPLMEVIERGHRRFATGMLSFALLFQQASPPSQFAIS